MRLEHAQLRCGASQMILLRSTRVLQCGSADNHSRQHQRALGWIVCMSRARFLLLAVEGWSSPIACLSLAPAEGAARKLEGIGGLPLFDSLHEQLRICQPALLGLRLEANIPVLVPGNSGCG